MLCILDGWLVLPLHRSRHSLLQNPDSALKCPGFICPCITSTACLCAFSVSLRNCYKVSRNSLSISPYEGFPDRFGWFYHFTVVLVFTNSCINPFIYAAKYGEFQHGVRRLISKRNREMSQSFEVVALSVRTWDRRKITCTLFCLGLASESAHAEYRWSRSSWV